MSGRAVAGRIGGPALFGSVFAAVFIVPVFPAAWHASLYRVLYTAIFFSAAFALGRTRKAVLGVAVAATAVEWIAGLLHLSMLTSAARVFTFCFFMYMVVSLIAQIARHRDVDGRVILAAANGYLLLGLAASMSIGAVLSIAPGVFAFSDGRALTELSDVVYYGFVTLTTVGYGDIAPNASYSRSLATLIGVTGQLYVAIVIAMLVGKYASTRR